MGRMQRMNFCVTALVVVVLLSLPTVAFTQSSGESWLSRLIQKAEKAGIVEKANTASTIWDTLKTAQKIGDEGRRTGCFERKTGWGMLEPPKLSEWGCLLQRR